MKKKLFFLWLILLLSFFSGISLADSDKSSISGINENKISAHEKPNELSRKLSDMETSFSGMNNKIDLNKENIKKNALDANNINIIHKKTVVTLNKKINNNQVNIRNIYGQLSATGEKTELIQDEIKNSTEFIKNSTEFINKNEIDININKDNIHSNDKTLSEHITASDKYKSDIEAINKTLHNLHQVSGLTIDYLDRFWVLIAAFLVFFMQAGFKTFESGMVRKSHNDNVAIKNILDWVVISLVYFGVGFGFMFGDSFNGLIGTSIFGPTSEVLQDVKNSIDGQSLGLEFFLYQLAFAATAATIVSGAMSERIALIPYIVLSVFIGVLIYPVFGHWAWGGTYLLENQGWLYAMGFRDFAGSTVVHSIGAWIALAGIIEIGARNGRYDKHGNLNTEDFVPSNMGYSALGVLILWFGWWGFNGGSQLKFDEGVDEIILHTILAGSAAGLTAFFHALSKSHDKYEVFPKLLGGILGGLVAITACCNSVNAWESILIGGIAGLVHNYSYDFLMLKLKLDDPVGAVAVHGFCGVWGTMCVAFFGDLNLDFFSQNSEMLLFLGDTDIRIKQIVIQLIGIVTAFVYAFSLAYLFFKIIRKIPGIGLRVLPSDEKTGSLLGISN